LITAFGCQDTTESAVTQNGQKSSQNFRQVFIQRVKKTLHIISNAFFNHEKVIKIEFARYIINEEIYCESTSLCHEVREINRELDKYCFTSKKFGRVFGFALLIVGLLFTTTA